LALGGGRGFTQIDQGVLAGSVLGHDLHPSWLNATPLSQAKDDPDRHCQPFYNGFILSGLGQGYEMTGT
jgi:hypothetical protein